MNPLEKTSTTSINRSKMEWKGV